MSKGQQLRDKLKRLTADDEEEEEIFELLEGLISDYEEEISRLKEEIKGWKVLEAVFKPQVHLNKADLQPLLVMKEETLPEHQEENVSVKEEEEKLWISQQGEQLQQLEEADLTKFGLTVITVKSENEDEEPESSSSRLDQSHIDDIIEAEPVASSSSGHRTLTAQDDGEDDGGPQAASNSEESPWMFSCFRANGGQNEPALEDLTNVPYVVPCARLLTPEQQTQMLRIKLRSARRPAAEAREPTQQHPPQSAAQRMQKYRQRLKKDGAKWNEYKELDAERKRQARRKRNEQQKERDRENGKERQRRYYWRKKAEGVTASVSNENTQNPVPTRSSAENQRQYWRDIKGAQRLKLSSQKKRRIREKDAARKRKVKVDNRSTPPPKQSQQNDEVMSNCARRQAVSRPCRHSPNDPNKFAAVVKGIVQHSNAAQKAAMKDVGVGLSNKQEFYKASMSKIKDAIQKLKDRRTDQARMQRRLLMTSLLVKKKYKKITSAEFGVRPGYITNLSKRVEQKSGDAEFLRKRRPGISDRTAQLITEFYKQPKVSRTLPCLSRRKK